jgi:hypothetical protein
MRVLRHLGGHNGVYVEEGVALSTSAKRARHDAAPCAACVRTTEVSRCSMTTMKASGA